MRYDVVYFGSAAPGAGTNIVPPGLEDQVYPTEGTNQIRVKPEAPLLLGAWYAAEATASFLRLRMVNRTTDLELIKSVDLNTLDPSAGFSDFSDNPIPLMPGQLLSAYSVNAGDEDTAIGLLLGDMPWRKPVYDLNHASIYCIRGILDKTLTALTWANAQAPTWDYVLPEGSYAIMGCKVFSFLATSMSGFWRLNLSAQKSASRTFGANLIGMSADKTLANQTPNNYKFHQWAFNPNLVFNSKTMPSFDLVSTGALTDFLFELNLCPI